jgi:hypothetical protein
LKQLHARLEGGLTETEALWSPLWMAASCVAEAARVLENREGYPAAAVQARMEAVLTEMRACRSSMGELADAMKHFEQVTRRYWPGLFHCYDVEGLPRTNNDLEQCFGRVRHQERRATGRKKASATLVVRGAVRLPASLGTPTEGWSAAELRPHDLSAWRRLRKELAQKHQAQRAQRRFRRHGSAFLARLEDKCRQLYLLS